MKTAHLTPTSIAWPAMWEAVADATGNCADYCETTGEVWQYMGTYDNVHQFRHRNRPRSARQISGFPGVHCGRVYLHIDAETLKPTHLSVTYYEPTE